MDCLGCNLSNKNVEVNVVYEDDNVCCILDHKPYNEGHVLILPKKHYRYFDELDENTAKSITNALMIISKAIKRLYKPDGITISQNGGIFDELTHFHMHVVPRYQGQNFADFYIEDESDNVQDKDKSSDTKRKIIDVIKGISIN